MAWARYDDELPMNKKIAALRAQGAHGLAALGLHVLVNTWSRHEGTAGHVPSYIACQQAGDNKLGKRLAAILEDVGMFDTEGDGWSIRNFDEFSDPNDDGRSASERKKEISAIRAEVGRRGGLAKAGKTASKQAGKTVAELQQTSGPDPVPVPIVSTPIQTSLQQTPEETALEARMKSIARRYAELRWDGANQKFDGPAAKFKNDEYRKAMEMTKCAQYAREYGPDCPIDVLANALNGNNSSLRYVDEHRVAS